MMTKRSAGALCGAMALGMLVGCNSPSSGGKIRYIGSSTIGKFIADAQQVYEGCQLTIWTEPESYGGEQAALAGVADIGGVARGVDPAIVRQGVVSTLIGKDAITVIVSSANPVSDLSAEQLKAVFTGRAKNWKELGGDDVPIRPFIVSGASATRNIFRSVALGTDNYAGCEVVEPDSKMIQVVAETKGAIGHISFAFLPACNEVKPLRIDGQEPSVWNPDYPITRPLYLCTLGRPQGDVKRFIEWVLSEAGQKLVRKRFVGVRSGS
ncbi:MAG: substrate-binding domain-containing protein [Planctomycetes bacterium]|nr:substrate-binding domain-containing protein [Planctomycetota bacterium]